LTTKTPLSKPKRFPAVYLSSLCSTKTMSEIVYIFVGATYAFDKMLGGICPIPAYYWSAGQPKYNVVTAQEGA